MITPALRPLITAAFFADYLDAFGPIGMALKLFTTFIFFLSYIPLALSTNRRKAAHLLTLVLLYIAYCIFKFDDATASTYELVKLLLPIILVMGLVNASGNQVYSSISLIRIEVALKGALSTAIVINGLAVITQVLIGNGPLIFAGVPAGYFEAGEKAGRFSGFILNLPLWSAMLFARIIRADTYIFSIDPWPLKKAKKIALYGLLFLSGQKFVIFFAIVLLLFRLTSKKKILLIASLAACIPIINLTSNTQIVDRLNQANLIAEEGIFPLIAQTDARGDYPQFRFLDLRINTWLYAWANVHEFPLGRGLGTWGDYSASLNPKILTPITLSETQWGHLIIEQGLGSMIIMMIFCAPFLFTPRIQQKNLRWLGAYVFLAGWFTMGSSDYLWFPMSYVVLFNLRAYAILKIRKNDSTRNAMRHDESR